MLLECSCGRGSVEVATGVMADALQPPGSEPYRVAQPLIESDQPHRLVRLLETALGQGGRCPGCGRWVKLAATVETVWRVQEGP